MRGLLALVWTAVGLGSPTGFVQAVAVSPHGAAVTIVSTGVGTASPRQQAFVWRARKKAALAYRGAASIQPLAIDAAGDVVGTAGDTAVLWRDGVPTALGAFTPNALSGTGAVVGTGTVGPTPHGYLWRDGTLTDLPGLGGETYADAVNAAGTVVGASALPSGVDHAVVWRDGRPTDLGSVGSLDSVATQIDAAGTIVGFASTHVGDGRVALEWRRGTLIDLGRFGAAGAQPVALNAHGEVLVQTQTVHADPVGLRLLLSGRTIAITVPALGRQHLCAVGLDDEGDVVGYGASTGRGFLWRDGRATLLPAGDRPVAVAGGWIVASRQRGGAVLLRLRG